MPAGAQNQVRGRAPHRRAAGRRGGAAAGPGRGAGRRGRGGGPVRAAEEEPQPDLVTRLAAKLFGQDLMESDAPMGMKRLDNPEMYQAVLDEFAEVLPEDTAEVRRFRPLLRKTQLEQARLRLAYDSAEDGFSAAAFLGRVATYGACVLLGETEGGAVFGAYNPRGWVGLGEEKGSISSFLFAWPEGYTRAEEAHKLRKVGGAGLAVTDNPDGGVVMGVDALVLPLRPLGKKGDERAAKSRLGAYFERRADGGRTLFSAAEGNKAQLKSLRAWVREGDPEKWELDGILWKTS